MKMMGYFFLLCFLKLCYKWHLLKKFYFQKHLIFLRKSESIC